MNTIIIKGRLVRDPEKRTLASGTVVCSFDVAVDRAYQKKDEERVADFFHCNAWQQQGEFISKYFMQGQEILVRGEMQSRKYEDKQGNKRTAWEINVERAEFCGSKSQNQSQSTSDPMAGFTDVHDDDIPF